MQDVFINAFLLAAGVFAAGLVLWLLSRAFRKSPDAMSSVEPGADAHASYGLPERTETFVKESEKYQFDIDGETHEYNSLDEVPPELRRIVEGRLKSGRGAVQSRITIDINGKCYEFNSIDEVPRELRKYLPPQLFG